MAKSFRCSIVTPNEAVFDGEVEYVSYQAWDGQQGILADQSPILSKMGIGSVRLDFAEGGSRWYLVDGGFCQAGESQLSLLTERAVPAEKLSLEEAKAELAEANARVVQTAEDRELVEHDQQWALAKKALAEMETARGGAI